MGNEPYATYLRKFNRPRLRDITPMFDDSVPFLVSGEMLMLTAVMDRNYNPVLGGQTLHLIYICERLLNVFRKHNGCFEIVFFDVWESVLSNPSLLLYRQIIKAHFKNDTDVPVHQFNDIHVEDFRELINKVRPGFFLYNLAAEYMSHFVKNMDFLPLFCAELIFCLKLDFPIVDLATVTNEVSTVKSYLLESDIDYEELPDVKKKMGKRVKPRPCVYQCKEIREFIVCNAVCTFLNDYPSRSNDAKLLVLYFAVLENLGLQNRGCPIIKMKDCKSEELIMEDVHIWQKIMIAFLKDTDVKDMDWKNIGDIWQGTLFAVVNSCVTEQICNGESLGEFAAHYEQYIHRIDSVIPISLTPYPIQPYPIGFGKFKMPYCRKTGTIFTHFLLVVLQRFCFQLKFLCNL